MLKFFFSIQVGKFISLVSRTLPFTGGSALPGLIALKINPTLINQITSRNKLKTVIITGTNGKTTTSRLISHILKQSKIKHIHNRTGSNLLRGVASALINQISLKGRLSSNLAIFELDEAVTPKAIKTLKPDLILFTNLFRDQLDRYGEIDTLLKNWQQSLKNLPKKSTLIYNSDDPSLNYLASLTKNSTISYGLPISFKQKEKPSDSADAIFCPKCQQHLKFQAIFTSHLGHYHCSKCNFKRNLPTHNPSTHQTTLPGLHNRYNILAATSLALKLDIGLKTINRALKSFTPAFGRAESFKLNQVPTNILLVKNPTGFNVTLETLKAKKHLNKPLLLILNDLIADGTDVSWIWDVEFEILSQRNKPVIASGLRAADLALRLKYAGLKPSLIIIKPSIKKALKSLQTQPDSPKYILPTYTAMLNLRRILTKLKLIHSTWED